MTDDQVLMHYAAAPVVLDRAYTYETGARLKPKGLWVSVQGEDDWPSWCREEEFRFEGLAHAHAVTLAADANILLIDTREAVDELAVRYPAALKPWQVWGEQSPDWQAIADEYDGIIIAPYQWESRLETFWYYGWDCASGCIWNLEAIASLVPVDERVEAGQ